MTRAGLKKAAGKPLVLLDCMPFIPAIGSTLQRVRFPSYVEYKSRMNELKSMISAKHRGLVEVSAAMDEQTHLMQAFLERGDARAGNAIWQVWERTHGNSMCLDDIWQAVNDSGIDPAQIFSCFLDRRLLYEGLVEMKNG
jgi:hypothetical protein